MTAEEFGPFLAEQRKKHNMTQSQLAEKLFVSTAAVSKWERCLCLPEISKLEDIAKLLDLSLMEIIQCRESDNPEAGHDAEAVQKVLEDTIQISVREKRKITQTWAEGTVIVVFAVFVMMRFWHVGPEFAPERFMEGTLMRHLSILGGTIMRYLPILGELFESDTIILMLLGAAISIFLGKRMGTFRKNRKGLILCFAVYAVCEILSNIRTNNLLEIMLLFVGTIAIGGVLGFLIGAIVSKVRNQGQ